MGQRIVEELFDIQPPSILYHYTTQKGLLGIIKNGELWATHTQYLNDNSEFSHAIAMVRDEVNSRIAISTPEQNSILKHMLGWLRLPLLKLNIFVCSFSEIDDSLSQWRAYGGSTSGFAIGFDGNALKKVALTHQFYLAKCIYKKETQLDIIRRLIDDILNFHEDEGKTANPVFDFPTSIIRCAPVFKDAHYESENEWRLISVPISPQSEYLGCRPGKSMLIPYFKLPLTNSKPKQKLPFKEIVIGPTPHLDASLESLGTLLSSNKVSECELRKSAVPYRNW